MKFSMREHNLIDALDKMFCLATKGVKSGYQKAGLVTIDVQPNKVLFRTSNGYLRGILEITQETDDAVKGSDVGEITADVKVLRAIIKAAGGSGNIITVSVKDNVLIVKDNESKTKKRRQASISIHQEHHKFTIKKSPQGFSHDFDTTSFNKGVASVAKYVNTLDYKVRYHMICMHFLANETRFVCGDGMRFGVYSYADTNTDVGDGVKYIIPKDQAAIITSMISDSPKVKITYENDTSCFINPYNNLVLHLRGIPDQKYIAYENHAFGQEDEVQAVLDVESQDFISGMALINSVRDKETETEGLFHSAIFQAAKDKEFELSVDEGRYQCSFSCPAKYTVVKDKENFKSEYSAMFLSDVAAAINGKSIVRFKLIDEYGTILAEPLDEGKDSDNRMLFFFASALDDNEE